AGTGAASWAAAECFGDLKQITCIEQSGQATALGRKLATSSPFTILQNARWIQQSLYDGLPECECAIASYVLNELENPINWIEGVWPKVETMILIEPGTPKHF